MPAETRFSRSFGASSHCLPSPDGELVATLASPSAIGIRRVRSLQLANVIKLPRDLSPPFVAFRWSPSSRRLLVASTDQLHVFSALDAAFHAVVRNPLAPGLKLGFVDFGASDAEVCMTSSLGLKLSVFDLAVSRTVEIANPKFYSASTAARAFSFRPRTHHLAVLTRTSARDLVSVHHPRMRDTQRSWNAETVDASGLSWSPDGRWLVVWEGPAHGHKVLFYTPDGQLFKCWSGPQAGLDAATRDCLSLGAGVKLLQFAADSSRMALADFSRTVYLLDMATIVEAARLNHPAAIAPTEDLELYQQNLATSPLGERPIPVDFVKSKHQALLPAGRPASENAELRTGPSHMVFDATSTFMASVLGDWPATVWIWDMQKAVLRSALLFHANVTTISWHPSIPSTLLIRCEGDQHSSLAFVWDAVSPSPRTINFLRGGALAKSAASCHCSWLDIKDTEVPTLFFTDTSSYILASLGSDGNKSPPWKEDSDSRDESTLDLFSAPFGGDESDDEPLDDTFHFRRNK
ncbi:hypothetical protein RB594_000660 [Gaeumannomyces avenae]